MSVCVYIMLNIIICAIGKDRTLDRLGPSAVTTAPAVGVRGVGMLPLPCCFMHYFPSSLHLA